MLLINNINIINVMAIKIIVGCHHTKSMSFIPKVGEYPHYLPVNGATLSRIIFNTFMIIIKLKHKRYIIVMNTHYYKSVLTYPYIGIIENIQPYIGLFIPVGNNSMDNI